MLQHCHSTVLAQMHKYGYEAIVNGHQDLPDQEHLVRKLGVVVIESNGSRVISLLSLCAPHASPHWAAACMIQICRRVCWLILVDAPR